MSDTNTLYDEDFFAWTKQQAKALRVAARSGTNQLLDWENLAGSQMRRIVQHLLKLEFSPATEPRRGWFESVGDARSEIEDLLETSPSLKPEASAALALALRQGSRKAIFDLEKYGEIDPTTLARIGAKTYTVDEVLGDWFPPEPRSAE